MKSQLLIGATGSGCGKTTFTAGLLRSIKRRGTSVQPFKCGPDYIDPHYHKLAAGCESVNLDSWLSSAAHVQYLYDRYAAPAEVCVTEGVMGLFDGYAKMRGSSAEIARLLDIPVVLIVNARSVAYFVAPVIYGFKHFDPDVRIAGVVFNRTASATHASYLKEACADVGVECFGCLPKINDLEIPSRHLGLTIDASFQFEQLIEKTADAIAANIDIDRLLEACRQTVLPGVTITPPARLPDRGLSIAVARDEAFTFTYKENIARLEQMGKVTYFSPIKDPTLPPADLVYLPGRIPRVLPERTERQPVDARSNPFVRRKRGEAIGRMRRHDVPVPLGHRHGRDKLPVSRCTSASGDFERHASASRLSSLRAERNGMERTRVSLFIDRRRRRDASFGRPAI